MRIRFLFLFVFLGIAACKSPGEECGGCRLRYCDERPSICDCGCFDGTVVNGATCTVDELLRAIERHLPRDPELDPTGMIRERQLLGVFVIGGYALTITPMLSDACARVLMRPAGLIAIPLLWLVTLSSVITWKWRILSRNQYGRSTAGLFVCVLLAFLGHRLIALRLGQSAEEILVEDMFLFATVFGVLSQTWAVRSEVFERWFIWLAAATALPAVVGAFVPERAPQLMGLLGIASVAIFAVRYTLDRRVRPEAIVRPHENVEDPVGSSRGSANEAQ